MATVNLGRIKPVFRGAYSGSTAYVIDDIVTSGGSSYICIQAHGAGTQAVTVTAYWSVMASTGTDLTSTLTTEGDIVYKGASALTRLAKGTGSQTLKMNAGATAPEWATVAAASADFVKIASVDGTGSSGVLDFQNCFSATYEKYLILANLYTDTTTQANLQFGNAANNATFRTAGYNHIGYGYYGSSGANGGGVILLWNTTSMKQNENHNTSATFGMTHSTLIYNPFDSTVETTWHMNWACKDSHVRINQMSGYQDTVESHSGFKYYAGAGNFRANSKVTVYGYKE
jgi:hypothetical protein